MGLEADEDVTVKAQDPKADGRFEVEDGSCGRQPGGGGVAGPKSKVERAWSTDPFGRLTKALKANGTNQ